MGEWVEDRVLVHMSRAGCMKASRDCEHLMVNRVDHTTRLRAHACHSVVWCMLMWVLVLVWALCVGLAEKALERGEKIDVLETRTHELSLSAAQFKSSSKSLHSKMWCQNAKTWLILLAVVVVRAQCGFR